VQAPLGHILYATHNPSLLLGRLARSPGDSSAGYLADKQVGLLGSLFTIGVSKKW